MTGASVGVPLESDELRVAFFARLDVHADALDRPCHGRDEDLRLIATVFASNDRSFAVQAGDAASVAGGARVRCIQSHEPGMIAL